MSVGQGGVAAGGSIYADRKFDPYSGAFVSRITKFSCVTCTPENISVRDPGSRFRLLAKHRCGLHKSTKPAAGQVFVSFVETDE